MWMDSNNDTILIFKAKPILSITVNKINNNIHSVYT